MVIIPMATGFGAWVQDIDLRRPLDASTQAALRSALDEHVLLSFPSQLIDDAQQLAFAAVFGTPTSYFRRKAAYQNASGDHRIISVTNVEDGVLKEAKDLGDEGVLASRQWHSDNSWREVPDRCTLLYGREVPPSGGNTEFIDLRAAWDALPQARRDALTGALVAHSRAHGRAAVGVRISDEERRQFPPVAQPLVRTNRHTGRQSLYLGVFASRVLGMAPDAGRQLLLELSAHAAEPRFVHAYAWRVNDLIIWDNAQTVHRSTPFEEHKYRRLMRRIGVLEPAALLSPDRVACVADDLAAAAD